MNEGFQKKRSTKWRILRPEIEILSTKKQEVQTENFEVIGLGKLFI